MIMLIYWETKFKSVPGKFHTGVVQAKERYQGERRHDRNACPHASAAPVFHKLICIFQPCNI